MVCIVGLFHNLLYLNIAVVGANTGVVGEPNG